MAGRPRNPTTPAFGQKATWLVDTKFPTNPSYARFVTREEDLVAALDKAVKAKTYPWPARAVPTKDTLARYISGKLVPSDEFLDWIADLFPDVDPASLRTDSFQDFQFKHDPIVAAATKWAPSIRFFAENRNALLAKALQYHSVANAPFICQSGREVPLLTAKGWIRDRPLEIKEDTEAPTLSLPAPFKEISVTPLDGFKSGYITVKGAITYHNKRRVDPEPQNNGEIYSAIDPILDDGGFRGFKYRLARYFDYIDQCEILGVELADAILSTSMDDAAQGETLNLPRRGPPGKAFELRWRASYPGVNCLCILRNYSDEGHKLGHYFLLHRRDETQSQAQNTVHVVPAGGHQALSAGSSDVEDTSLWRTMFREFTEELFDKEKVSRQAENWVQFNRHPSIIEMRRIFLNPDSLALRCHLLGFGLDPITLKPEVLMVIDVDWGKAVALRPGLKLKFNWELKTPGRAETRHELVSLSKENLLRHADGNILKIGDRYLPTLPAGAACLLLTADHYSFLGLPEPH